MNLAALWSILALVLAFIAGGAVVFMLMGNARHTVRYRLLAIMAVAGSVLVCWEPLDGIAAWLTAFLALVALVTGYALRVREFVGRDDSRFVPVITRTPGGVVDGHHALIYFTRGEPENYDPTGLLGRYRLADHLGMPAMPLLMRPFAARRLRERYKVYGPSRSRAIHRRTLRALTDLLRATGDVTTRVYMAFVEDEPRPDAAVIQALNDGAASIVVCEVFAARDQSSRIGEEWMRGLATEEKYAVPLIFTEPIGASPRLAQIYCERIHALDDRALTVETGVVVVGRGERRARNAKGADQPSQEELFLADLTAAMLTAGFSSERVRYAWIEHGKPRLTRVLPDLVSTGVRRILVIPATSSADDWHSLADVPEAIASANLASGVEVINLGAWNADPLAVQAMADSVAAIIVAQRP